MAKSRGKGLRRKREVVRGGGIVSSVLNKAIDLLPVELHLRTPSLKAYQFCGPGTKLQERLARGDKGINKLDEACKAHDIAYSRYSDSERRRQADKELAERAWQRFKSSDANFGEKAASLIVTGAMKAKTTLGGGRKKKRPRRVIKRQRGRGLYLRPYTQTGGGRRKNRTTRRKKKPCCYR